MVDNVKNDPLVGNALLSVLLKHDLTTRRRFIINMGSSFEHSRISTSPKISVNTWQDREIKFCTHSGIIRVPTDMFYMNILEEI